MFIITSVLCDNSKVEDPNAQIKYLKNAHKNSISGSMNKNEENGLIMNESQANNLRRVHLNSYYDSMSEQQLREDILKRPNSHPLKDFLQDEFSKEATKDSIDNINWIDYLSKIKSPNNCRWMMFFGAAWCNFCRQFAPFYREFAMEVNGKLKGENCLKFSWTDCQSISGSEICNKLHVSSYPTVLIYDNGFLMTL